MIPGTEYNQTRLPPIPRNDPKFIYDLIKFYNFNAKPNDVDGKAAMFTNTSDERELDSRAVNG